MPSVIGGGPDRPEPITSGASTRQQDEPDLALAAGYVEYHHDLGT